MAVTAVGNGTFEIEVTAGDYTFIVDEAERLGGRGSGPDPFDLLAASLGACTAIVAIDAARERGLKIDHVRVQVTPKFNKIASSPGDPDLELLELRRRIRIETDASAQDLEWLYERCFECPVSRALNGVAVRTERLEPRQNPTG